MKKKTIMKLIAAALTGSLFLSGCGGTNATQTTQEATVEEAEENEADAGDDAAKEDDADTSDVTFAGGDGSENDPWQIETAQQFDAIRNDLTASYVLTADIDLSGTFTPIGIATMADFDEQGQVDAAKAFTGNLNGGGHTVSNAVIEASEGMVGVGIFGVTTGESNIKDIYLDAIHVSGAADSLAVGGLIGYGMSMGSVENVTLTSSEIKGTNAVGGIVGGDTTNVIGCTAEDVTITLFGDNTEGEYSFTSGLLRQHDVAECGGAVVGGGFTGTVTGCKAINCTINGDTEAVEAVGLGGIGGCLQCMNEIKDNHVEGLTINGKGAHAIGGLCGYAGNGNMAEYGYGENSVISDCTVKGLTINAKGATHTGGLVGTNLYFMGMEGHFEITSGCLVEGTITAGTNEDSVYGVSVPGLIAGRAAGCVIEADACDVSGLMINDVEEASEVGVNTVMYESLDQDATLFQQEAGEQMDALFATYRPLFEGAIFNKEYDHYWEEAVAGVMGEDGASETAAMLKASIGGNLYGQEAVDAYTEDPDSMAFFCGFTNDIATFCFDGTVISGFDSAGNEVFSHAYKCIGEYGIGADEGIPDFNGYMWESLDGGEDGFRYFLIMPDTPKETYHIEFRYGDDLEAMQQYAQGDYAYWLAAGIPVDALTDPDEEMIKNVIELFCTENLEEAMDEAA